VKYNQELLADPALNAFRKFHSIPIAMFIDLFLVGDKQAETAIDMRFLSLSENEKQYIGEVTHQILNGFLLDEKSKPTARMKTLLGLVYYYGINVKPDVKKAFDLFSDAGKSDPYAIMYQGLCVEKFANREAILSDLNPRQYHAAAQKLGVRRANSYLGLISEKENKGYAAMGNYLAGAAAGDPFSQSNLGAAYRQGLGIDGVVGKNPSLAKENYIPAAKAGSANALNGLGILIKPQEIKPENLAEFYKAAVYFRYAAEKGNRPAQENLYSLFHQLRWEKIFKRIPDSFYYSAIVYQAAMGLRKVLVKPNYSQLRTEFDKLIEDRRDLFLTLSEDFADNWGDVSKIYQMKEEREPFPFHIISELPTPCAVANVSESPTPCAVAAISEELTDVIMNEPEDKYAEDDRLVGKSSVTTPKAGISFWQSSSGSAAASSVAPSSSAAAPKTDRI